MKTYNATVQKPLLEIYYDNDNSSPREDSNLGYWITCDRNSKSPDQYPELEQIIKSTGDEANNQEHHIKMIKKQFEDESGYKVLTIYPIVKYEHSSVTYSLGSRHGFDYSNNGFYIITDKTQKELGVKSKDFEKVIKQELDVYNQWVNGEVYGYTLYDDQGNIVDSCGGFYDLDDIKENLPEEYKNEDLTEYIK